MFLKLSPLLVALLLACFSDNRVINNTYTLTETAIDSIEIKDLINDTIAYGNPVEMVVYYFTGAQDCYAFHDKSVTPSDSTVRISVREKVYANRICLDVSSLEYQSLTIDSLDPGYYHITASVGSGDSVFARITVQ